MLLLLAGLAVGQEPQRAGPLLPAFDPSSGAMPIISSSKLTTAQWVAPGKSVPTILQTSGTAIPALVRQGTKQKGEVGGREEKAEFQSTVSIPDLERLSQLNSEAKLQDRIRQETLERTSNEPIVFPEEPILSKETYKGRVGQWQVRQLVVEPNYLNHGKLYFQQLNTERYGWDLGALSPLICAGKFYADLVMAPLTFGARPCERESNTGYFLPGDPVPLLLYPPEITVTGVSAEAAVILALVAIFP